MYRFEIFAFEKYIGYRDVEIQVRITQSHWKWHYSMDRAWFPISVQ